MWLIGQIGPMGQVRAKPAQAGKAVERVGM